MVFPARASPRTAHNHQDVPNDKEMALPPDSCRGDDENPCHAHATKVIAREKRSIHESDLFILRNGHGVGRHDGAERGAEDCHKGQNG